MGIHFHQRDQFVRIVELTPALRREIEGTIESLIALLDQYDGDEELEDDGCGEPWLSSGAEEHKTAWRNDHGEDREAEDEYDEEGAEDEPTMGAPENHPTSRDIDWTGRAVPRSGKHCHVPEKSQLHWAAGSTRDDECEIENEHGGDILDEPHDEDSDDEPSLAFTEALNQASAHRIGDWSDRELDMTEGRQFEGWA